LTPIWQRWRRTTIITARVKRPRDAARRNRRKRSAGGAKNGAKKLILTVIGWFFVALGILGLFLPVLQGILFLLIGFSILASVSPRARLLRQRMRKRHPKAAAKADQAYEWVRQRWRRLFRQG